MKHVEVVKAVLIGGKLYTDPKHAAKRWVEVAGREIQASAARRDTSDARQRRAWLWWKGRCWVVAGKRQRYWRRVLPIFERLLR